MKQLKRLKNMLSGGDKSEDPNKTEEQKQSDTEMKTNKINRNTKRHIRKTS
jgi:hypothetical protein